MLKMRPRNIFASIFAVVCLVTASFMFYAQAATVINDVFADGSSTNQDLANNSLAVYKARSGTTRIDAIGSVEYNVTNSGGSDAYWAYFTNSGSPLTLGVGDTISFAGTFSLTGAGTGGSDIRFGLLNSNGSRAAADKTGGQNDANFADDTGYGAQFYGSATGNPFILYRKDASPTTNIFNSMGTTSGGVATGWSPLAGSGATARQTLVDNTPYTFNYSVRRVSATETQVTIAVTGGALANLNYTATETSQTPYTAFDWFSFRIAGAAFATKIKFTQFKVDFNPAAPVITTQPAPSSQTVAVGSNVQFSVAASGSNLSYQWLKNGNAITGNASAQTATLQINSAQTTDSGAYSVRVSNAGGEAVSYTVNLTVSSGQVNPPPAITQQPQNTTATVGTAAALSVTATGDNLSYQWFKDNVLIGGATNATLNFASVQNSDTGNYKVTITNANGSVTSDTVRLTVVSTIAATAFSPVSGSAAMCADTPLAITFNQTPRIGTSGAIRIYRADGTLVDTIDLATSPQTKTIGGVSAFRYYPIIIEGNTANIYPHNQLAYNQTYYVTMDAGVLTDAANVPFGGFSDQNTFRFSTKAAVPASGATSLTVAADNSGDFCTIQGAVDFVPANNAQRVFINVKNGTYTEIVYIPSNKPFITVRGESRAGTVQRYANNSNLNGAVSGNYRTSFGVDAADFNLENITLHNTTPQGGSQAEAIRTNGLRATINSVNLKSFQDTVLTQRSAVIANSYIEGDVDFMWGNGATFFKNTELKSLRDGGYYTQIRNSGANSFGNVYVNCRFTKGAGVTTGNYLSRIDPDDFPASQVVIIDSQMDSHIAPIGWLFNNPTNTVDAANYPNIRFWESNTRALDGVTPVDCSQRHPISRSDCRNPLSSTERDFYLNPANTIGFTPQEKLSATVTLSNFNQTYDGNAKTIGVVTNPANLNVVVTYNGSTSAPTNAGTYAVVATIDDANYQGSATGTLTIAKAAATVTLSNLVQNYDGTAKTVTVTTVPSGLNVTVTYNNSANAPTALGNYNVVATVSDPNYTGAASGVLTIQSTIKAFPTAEGAGAYAVGGRGGDTYHVTNLNDTGAGSLRNGITTATGARTIVFDVAGTINLNSRLVINKSFLTIAGQTAPGDGITIAGWTTNVTNAQHVIIRYLRFRAGDIRCGSGMEGDSLWVDNSKDVMIDHVSASWSIDESLSVTDSDRVSVQWSFITESLNLSCHPEGRHGYGSLIRYGSGRISFHHNLYAHHFNRNPRVGDNITLDFVNNVIYDWGTDASYSGAASEGITKVNYIGNYLVAGPNTPSSKRNRAFNGGSTNTLIYQTGNVIDGNVNGIHDGTDTGWAMFNGSYTQQTEPLNLAEIVSEKSFAPSAININAETAETAYNRVLNEAGSSRARDAVDARIKTNVQNETGAFINSQNDVGGYPALNSPPAPTDTDGDGMPDQYEINRGLNPNDANDAATIASNGYTNLENFLNGTPLAPTAANAALGGRVVTASGRGIARMIVTAVNSQGVSTQVLTNSFGYFRFGDVQVGETYIVTVSGKRHTFSNPSRVYSISEDVSEVLFVAEQ